VLDLYRTRVYVNAASMTESVKPAVLVTEQLKRTAVKRTAVAVIIASSTHFAYSQRDG